MKTQLSGCGAFTSFGTISLSLNIHVMIRLSRQEIVNVPPVIHPSFPKKRNFHRGQRVRPEHHNIITSITRGCTILLSVLSFLASTQRRIHACNPVLRSIIMEPCQKKARIARPATWNAVTTFANASAVPRQREIDVASATGSASAVQPLSPVSAAAVEEVVGAAAAIKHHGAQQERDIQRRARAEVFPRTDFARIGAAAQAAQAAPAAAAAAAAAVVVASAPARDYDSRWLLPGATTENSAPTRLKRRSLGQGELVQTPPQALLLLQTPLRERHLAIKLQKEEKKKLQK